jgi:hypothetical protein
MNPVLYLAAKAKGKASIVSHGGDTILVSMPAGYDPDTGAALPPKEAGYQRNDIAAMRESAAAHVVEAEAALERARERLAAFDDVLHEISGLA